MKTGKNKRLLASILAASMLLAMSPFALADENTPDTTGQGQPAGQTYAAKIGENKYPTIADAIDAANIMMQTAMSLSSCSMMLRKISRLTGL